MHHPHSHLVIQQIAADRRRDLESAARGARARAAARRSRQHASRRVVDAVRRRVWQPAT